MGDLVTLLGNCQNPGEERERDALRASDTTPIACCFARVCTGRARMLSRLVLRQKTGTTTNITIVFCSQQ